MKTYPLTVSTPDGNLFSGQVQMLTLRGIEGDLAVLAGHIPFMTAVVSGKCCIVLEDDTEKNGQTDGGLLSVKEDGVTLISSSFVFIEE